MGTRADFYIGRGEQAEWLGSIAWDGYPDGIDHAVLEAQTAEEFREELAKFAAGREDWTAPDRGWPWPWEDSGTTDYAYAFDDGIVWGTNFGYGWWPATEEQEADRDEPKVPFPNMKERQKVTFGKRSGVIVAGPKGVILED